MPLVNLRHYTRPAGIVHQSGRLTEVPPVRIKERRSVASTFTPRRDKPPEDHPSVRKSSPHIPKEEKFARMRERMKDK